MQRKYIKCDTADEAYERAPWATTAVKAKHGYRIFSSEYAYNQWKGEHEQTRPLKNGKELKR